MQITSWALLKDQTPPLDLPGLTCPLVNSVLVCLPLRTWRKTYHESILQRWVGNILLTTVQKDTHNCVAYVHVKKDLIHRLLQDYVLNSCFWYYEWIIFQKSSMTSLDIVTQHLISEKGALMSLFRESSLLCVILVHYYYSTYIAK